jgi:hypothetical protein
MGMAPKNMDATGWVNMRLASVKNSSHLAA